MKPLRIFVFISMMGSALAADPIPGCVASRDVPFDTFMQGQLKNVPLTVPVPTGYEPVPVELMRGSTYSYWMPPKEVDKAMESGDLPAHTGYMYGKLSLDVAWLEDRNRFSIMDKSDEEFAANGMTVVRKEQVSVNGHPLLFMEVTMPKLDRKVWMLYIAMNIDSNAAYFTYVPPKNDVKTGDCFWKHLVQVVKASAAPAAAN